MSKGNMTSKKPNSKNEIKGKTIERKSNKIDPLLYDLLVLASPSKPDGSIGDHEAMVRSVIMEHVEDCRKKTKERPSISMATDSAGNLIVRVGPEEGENAPTVAFSAHMDTVHDSEMTLRLGLTEGNDLDSKDGFIYASAPRTEYRYLKLGEKEDSKYLSLEEIIKTPPCDPADKNHKAWSFEKIVSKSTGKPFGDGYDYGLSTATWKTAVTWTLAPDTPRYKRKAFQVWSPSVLGADDKTGCFIMCKLIEAYKPGLYLFHVNEEHGNDGSTFIANKSPRVFKGITKAIAFDRMGYSDIIASQRGGVCCSEEFVKSFADELNQYLGEDESKYTTKGVTGVFTDTANYRKLVAECTNISVGYHRHHSREETQDYKWLVEQLIPALIKCDFESLVVKRDPTKPDPRPNYQQGGYGSYSSYYGSRYDADGKIKLEYLTKYVEPYKYPDWEPCLGWNLETTKREAKVLVIKNWIMNTHPDKVAEEIAELVDNVELAAWWGDGDPYSAGDNSQAGFPADSDGDDGMEPVDQNAKPTGKQDESKPSQKDKYDETKERLKEEVSENQRKKEKEGTNSTNPVQKRLPKVN